MQQAALGEQLTALKLQAIDDFSRSCLEGARLALENLDNPLRLNFFSTAMRILFEHMMDTLAPIEAVMQCAWYKPEKEDGKPTRGQRITYAIQGGLSEEFVTEQLRVNPQPLRRRLLDAVDGCSKQVHAREHSVILNLGEQDAMAASTIAAVGELLDALHFCRRSVLEPIMESLDDAAVDTLLNESLVEVDELATHWSLQDVYVHETVVHAIGPEAVTYRSTGSIDVILQFGSNSDVRNDVRAELPQTFPFTCDIVTPLEDPWDLGQAETRCGVDVSKWADAMRPEDWGDGD